MRSDNHSLGRAVGARRRYQTPAEVPGGPAELLSGKAHVQPMVDPSRVEIFDRY
jgi:hypothetical protein